MKALITGGAGFIGSSLGLHLRDLGWTVYTVDNLSTGRKKFLDDLHDVGCHVFVEDYGDDFTRDLIVEKQFDVVFHVGAVPRVAYSVEHPASTEHNNVYQTLRMLEACRDNVGRVVYSSSSSVLGGTHDMTYPTNESYSKAPLSPYACQKAAMEDYLYMFWKLYELDSVSLRYFNVFGPRQYGDSPYSTVVSAWCQALHDGRPLRLDGTGEQSRDFCYIDNVVQANVLAAKAEGTLSGMPINIAHGEEHDLNYILKLFRAKFGDDIDVTHADWRPGDVMRTWADITKAKNILDYNPTVKFEEGLKRTWEWWGF